ncbi:MAG: outer membrane protein assembly factor BamB family protein, partial [Planctomycetota bacterium]
CISRASGEILWRKDLTDCHALVGLARADEAIDEATAKPNDAGRGRLVLQGIGLECLDAVTGTRLWRWRPDRKSGPIHGRSALGGPYVYLPTESGLYRLRIGDGGTHSFDPWRALSVDGGPVGNLIVRPDCILGFDSGRLVKISAAPREAAGAGGRKLTSAPAPGKIEITGTARRDISIRSSGLPPAELGPPLVARWHLGGGPATVHRPPPRSSSFGEASSPGREAARDGTGELYIRLGDGLARISPEEQRIVWQSRIVPGVWGLAFTGDMVLAVYRRHIYAFDRATGACLWTRSVLPETSGFTPVDLRDERRNYVVVGATSHGVTVRHADAHYVHGLDPKTRRRILELELREVYHATCLRGELVLVRHEHGKLLVEGRKLPGAFSGAGGAGRKPVAGDVLWHEDLQVRRSGDTGTILSPDGRDLYIYGGGKLARMSLSLREAVFTRPVAALRDVRLRFEGGHLVILGKGGGKEWKSIAVEPETGKVLLEARADDAGKRPEGRAYTYSPGRAVGVFRDDKKKRYSAVCLSVPGGKELWKVALGSHEERMVGGVAAGRYWVQLHARDHGARPGGGRIRSLLYRLVDVRTGKVVGEGDLPGGMHDKHDRRSPWQPHGVPAVYTGRYLVYGTRQGVFAAGGPGVSFGGAEKVGAGSGFGKGGTPVPWTGDGRAADVPPPTSVHASLIRATTEHLWRRPERLPPPEREGASEFVATYAPPYYQALTSGAPTRVDGRLDDWAGSRPIVLDHPLQVRALAAGGRKSEWTGPEDLSARAHVSFDARYVYLAVEVTDDRHVGPGRGASLITGDSILLAIDPEGSSFDEFRPGSDLVLQAAMVEGRPRLVQLSGRPVDPIGPAAAVAREAPRGEGPGPAETEKDRASLAVVRRGGSLVYELALPWSALRERLEERPGLKRTIGLGVAVIDSDGGDGPSSAIEWGAGLPLGEGRSGVRPRLFGRVKLFWGVDLPEDFLSDRGTGKPCDVVIRNRLNKPVTVWWFDFDGRLRKYHDLAPGQTIKQNTYDGHRWEARVDGLTVSLFSASVARPAWDIGG